MPSRKRTKIDLRTLCAEIHPDDGVDPRENQRRGAEYEKKPNRKLWQLCKQVTQTLQLTLGALPRADALAGASVREVTPAPHAGRLRVVVTVANERQREAVATILERHGGRLRSEVAMAITRRKAPELTFEVMVQGGEHV